MLSEALKLDSIALLDCKSDLEEVVVKDPTAAAATLLLPGLEASTLALSSPIRGWSSFPYVLDTITSPESIPFL
jgi:hypothetical protein